METLDDALGRIAELYYDEIFKFCFRRVNNHQRFLQREDIIIPP